MEMDRDDVKMLAFLGGVMTFVIVVAVVLAALIESASCTAKFRDSGLGHRWSFMGGCRVNVPGHGWTPAQNYRAI